MEKCLVANSGMDYVSPIGSALTGKEGEQMKRKPYTLQDDQCERLLRSEMTALRILLAALSSAAYAQTDLQKRLECIPYGKERLRMAVGGLRAVCDDLIGTVSRQQCQQIYGTMMDFEMRLLPKLTPGSTNIIMTQEQGKDLIDCARWKCQACVEDGNSCRQCRLYKLLEATTPLDDYGEGLICPYALQEWA